MHQLVADTEVVVFTEPQKLLTLIDGAADHAAGNQGVEIRIADTHIRPGFQNIPEITDVLFEAAFLFQLPGGGVHELPQCRKLLVQLILQCEGDQLKLRVHVLRLQLQRFMEIFKTLFLRRRLIRQFQIIIRGFRTHVLAARMTDAVFRQEPVCQPLHAVLICRFRSVERKELLQFLHQLFCLSAHCTAPPSFALSYHGRRRHGKSFLYGSADSARKKYFWISFIHPAIIREGE